MSRFHVVSFAAMTIGLVACADAPTAPAPVAAAGAASRSVAPTWATTITGTTGPGAQYAIFVPAPWNGDVVYYAHGIVDAALPVALPTSAIAELRDSLGVMGYAVAYSSFSQNGWAVKDGIERTHQLRGLFESRVGEAKRSYVIGHSMGGLIALALAEKFPRQYDGALPMCGVLDGAQHQIDYIANVRTVFDYFYPGVLPGNAVDIQPELDLNTQVLGPAQFAIVNNPNGAGAMAQIVQTPLPFADPPELVQSILTAIAFDARGADDIVDRTHEHSPFGNSATTYAGLLPPPILADLNARVARFTETPDAAKYLAKYYEPSGDLRIPTVTIHTTRDPVVPVFHESGYAGRAAAEGASSNLLQRSISRYGHCAFAIGEMTDAFRALTGWVVSGVRPAE